MEPKKKWWKSKTLWVNAIAMIAVLLSKTAGVELTAAETAAALVVVNMFMRAITGTGLEA